MDGWYLTRGCVAHISLIVIRYGVILIPYIHVGQDATRSRCVCVCVCVCELVRIVRNLFVT